MAPLRVGLLGYDQVNALDLVGPAEAFASALYQNSKDTVQHPYHITILGLTKRSFVAESGITFQPAATIETALKLDTLVIPGGSGLRDPAINRKVAAWVLDKAPQIRRIASVCTGIYGLAPTGLLDD